MKKILVLIAALSVPASATLSSTARADDTGRVVAGAAGGFLGGLFLGSVLSHPRPAPAYQAVEPGPVYYAPPPCHWEPGRPYWDDYYGVWRRPRIRVCD